MFKDRIKEARKNSGLSQEKLGMLLGVSKQTVSDYERGYSEPDMAKVGLIMSILNVDANYLWQDEMQNNDTTGFSERAFAIARAYDSMSEYGKSIIDMVFENEKKFKIV